MFPSLSLRRCICRFGWSSGFRYWEPTLRSVIRVGLCDWIRRLIPIEVMIRLSRTYHDIFWHWWLIHSVGINWSHWLYGHRSTLIMRIQSIVDRIYAWLRHRSCRCVGDWWLWSLLLLLLWPIEATIISRARAIIWSCVRCEIVCTIRLLCQIPIRAPISTNIISTRTVPVELISLWWHIWWSSTGSEIWL